MNCPRSHSGNAYIDVSVSKRTLLQFYDSMTKAFSALGYFKQRSALENFSDIEDSSATYQQLWITDYGLI